MLFCHVGTWLPIGNCLHNKLSLSKSCKVSSNPNNFPHFEEPWKCFIAIPGVIKFFLETIKVNVVLNYSLIFFNHTDFWATMRIRLRPNWTSYSKQYDQPIKGNERQKRYGLCKIWYLFLSFVFFYRPDRFVVIRRSIRTQPKTYFDKSVKFKPTYVRIFSKS